MNEDLRSEFIRYLADHNLKPRRLPANSGEIHEKIARAMYEEAKRRGDPVADAIWETYESNKTRYLAETRHPAVQAIEDAAESIEETIRAIPSFQKAFANDIFVGEFPTGSINSEVVKVERGFLVLVNSGTGIVLEQVSQLLAYSDPSKPSEFEANAQAVTDIIEIIATYLKHGDPFYGPKPFGVGEFAMLGAALSKAALKFVVAHEYGHVIAGHFNDADPSRLSLNTLAGPIEVLKKQCDQELQADEIGYRLTLGLERYDDIDLNVVDEAFADNPQKLLDALKLKCRIAAPFLLLTIVSIIEEVGKALGNAQMDANTHPPANLRMDKLIDIYGHLDPRYSGFINLNSILWRDMDKICGGIVHQLRR